MAAAQNSKKIRSNKLRNGCFPFKCCFGCSNKEIKDSDGKGTKRTTQNMTVPIIHSKFTTSSQVFDSSKEDRMIETREKSSHRVNSNKKRDVVLETSTSTVHELSRAVGTTQEILETSAKFSHSVSLPLPSREKGERLTYSEDKGKKSKNGEGLIIGDGLESMFGALIITVTLIIMLIWGKACAIICTAAWFYFIPRFRPSNHEFKVMKLRDSSNHIDLGSREYKKRVVLEGFLGRN